MTWLPQAKEALDRAERIAIGRAELISTTLDQLRAKKGELEALDAELNEAIKDLEVESPEGSTEKALKALLHERKGLHEELEQAAAKAQEQDRERAERSQEHRHLRDANERLESELRRERDALARLTAVRETRVETAEEQARVLGNVLRDVHYALLHQPAETRENIASMIARIVEPYTEGERPQ